MKNSALLHRLMTVKIKQHSRFKSAHLIAILMSVMLPATPVFSHSGDAIMGTVLGTVSTIGPDGQSYHAPGAKVRLESTAQTSSLFVLADDSGEFKFSSVTPGNYKLEVALEGFEETARTISIHAGETAVENVTLEVKTIREVVTIKAAREGMNATDAEPATEPKQSTLQTIRLVNERFQDALPRIPGVLRGPDGLMNVKGSRPSQSGLTVNSTNVTDPVTGEFAINLPIEA